MEPTAPLVTTDQLSMQQEVDHHFVDADVARGEAELQAIRGNGLFLAGQVFQRLAHTDSTRLAFTAKPVPREKVNDKTERAKQVSGKYNIIKAMQHQHPVDAQHSYKLTGC